MGSVLAMGVSHHVLLSERVLFHGLAFHPAQSALSIVPSLAVTALWSLLLAPLWSTVGYIDWGNRIAGTPFLYGPFASVTVLSGAFLNAAIVYWIGSAIARPARSGTTK